MMTSSKLGCRPGVLRDNEARTDLMLTNSGGRLYDGTLGEKAGVSMEDGGDEEVGVRADESVSSGVYGECASS